MKTLLIAWHSRTHAAEQMAAAAATGAMAIAKELQAEDGFLLLNQAVQDISIDTILSADAYLFAAPENLASLSGGMKEFFDSNYYPALGKLNGRPYGAIITAGSDGQGAQRQLERICQGWRLQLIAPSIIVPMQAQTPEAILAPKTVPTAWLDKGHELGATLAALIL